MRDKQHIEDKALSRAPLYVALGFAVLLIIFWFWVSILNPKAAEEKNGNAEIEVSDSETKADTPEISVLGKAEVEVKPDLAKIVAVIEKTDKVSVQAQSLANSEVSAVIKSAKNTGGITDDDIQTSRIALTPEYDYSEKNPQVIGYRASVTVTFTVNADKAGAVYDAAVGNGALTGWNSAIEYILSPELKGKTYNEALELAVKNGEEKARILAKSAGINISKPFIILEGRYAESRKNVSENEMYDAGSVREPATSTITYSGHIVVAAFVGIIYN